MRANSLKAIRRTRFRAAVRSIVRTETKIPRSACCIETIVDFARWSVYRAGQASHAIAAVPDRLALTSLDPQAGLSIRQRSHPDAKPEE